jgi:hypothetical protein
VKSSAISVIRVKRCVIYRPLAAILALLVVQMFSGFLSDVGIQADQASAASLGPSKAIIRNACIGSKCYTGDTIQLEADAVQAYLGLHNLPAGDAQIIYDYGRADLRDAVRGMIFNILLGIINKPASERTPHETALYAWLQGLVWQNQIQQFALARYWFLVWEQSPCFFSLDPVIASAYGLSYDGSFFCEKQFKDLDFILRTDIHLPNPSYFYALGLKLSYGKPALEFSNFGSLVADTAINVAAVTGITAGIAALASAGLPSLLSKSLSLALAASNGTTAGVIKSAAYALSAAAMGALAPAQIDGGAITTVLIGVALGVAARVGFYSPINKADVSTELDNTLKQVTDTPPDLNAFANNSIGMYKLQATLVAQTEPDVPGNGKCTQGLGPVVCTDLPVHSDRDLNFAIQKSNDTKTLVSDTLAYEDWNGSDWSAQTWRGWFVQSCKSGDNCTQAGSINANLRTWTGRG